MLVSRLGRGRGRGRRLWRRGQSAARLPGQKPTGCYGLPPTSAAAAMRSRLASAAGSAATAIGSVGAIVHVVHRLWPRSGKAHRREAPDPARREERGGGGRAGRGRGCGGDTELRRTRRAREGRGAEARRCARCAASSSDSIEAGVPARDVAWPGA
eukprot:7386103-Prymnesium_polylepis.1